MWKKYPFRCGKRPSDLWERMHALRLSILAWLIGICCTHVCLHWLVFSSILIEYYVMMNSYIFGDNHCRMFNVLAFLAKCIWHTHCCIHSQFLTCHIFSLNSSCIVYIVIAIDRTLCRKLHNYHFVTYHSFVLRSYHQCHCQAHHSLTTVYVRLTFRPVRGNWIFYGCRWLQILIIFEALTLMVAVFRGESWTHCHLNVNRDVTD
jgi:hypothetical protein